MCYLWLDFPGLILAADFASMITSRLVQCAFIRYPLGLRKFYVSKAVSNAPELVYVAPFRKALTLLKTASVASSVVAVLSTPVLVLYGKEDVPVSARIALCGMLVVFFLGTNAMCHWCLKSYVIRMFYDVSRGRVTAETLSLFSRREHHVFHIQEANTYEGLQGFANFQVHNKPFYVHTEPEIFKDRILLSKLLGTNIS